MKKKNLCDFIRNKIEINTFSIYKRKNAFDSGLEWNCYENKLDFK